MIDVSSLIISHSMYGYILLPPQTGDRYPEVLFYGTPWKQTVTLAGGHINWWQEIGVKFDIPPGAVPEGKELDLSVWPCVKGPFQLPIGYELASPIFLISPSF